MTKRFRRNGENMDILNEAKKNFDYMVRIRRHMHEYPENSGVEYETVKYIASELDALGIEYVVVPEGGIIGQIHGGKPGKTVLLRADRARQTSQRKRSASPRTMGSPTPADMMPTQRCFSQRQRS